MKIPVHLVWATLAVGAFSFGGWQQRSAADPAPAPEVGVNPWSRDQMAVIGTLHLENGLRVDAVHVPGWPLSQTCLVVAGNGTPPALHCDTDAGSSLAALPPPPKLFGFSPHNT